MCTRIYNDGKFSILARGCAALHFSTLEATYIKISKPNLCEQKEFVYCLKIAHSFLLLLLVASFTNHKGAFFFFVDCVSICVTYFIFFTLFQTNSHKKCQTKSFKIMNTLLSAIFIFCTTNQLLLFFKTKF